MGNRPEEVCRIRSLSLSVFIISCSLILVVRVLVKMAMIIMIIAEIRFAGIIKFRAKKG